MLTLSPAKERDLRPLFFSFSYVATVLTVDTLATLGIRFPFNWRLFHWTIGSFDLFKFSFWLLLPLAFSLRNFDWSYYGWQRWNKVDGYILLSLALVGTASIFCIGLFPGLRNYYPSRGTLDESAKLHFLQSLFIWNLSWLPAWEFLNRYFLLRSAHKAVPRYTVWIVAIAEGVYHLQKPWPEATGMVCLSLLLSTYAIRRRNGLLPLIVHAIIEIALGIYLVL